MERFPKIDLDDPSSLHLLIDRYQRVNIPSFPAPEIPPSERNNFLPVFLGYSEEQALVEAARCIHCPSPEPCILGCPVHNDIPTALLLIEQGEYVQAADVFRATGNFPRVCGRLCPQEKLCEGSCTVAAHDRAVNIGKLEAFCADWQVQHEGYPIPPMAKRTGRRVAIVGSGPAGLTVAEQLTIAGHECVVYEEWPKPGGLLLYGIPGFKLGKEIVAEKVAYLENSLGVKFVCNTRVGRDIQVDELLREYDAVFLGIGAPIENKAGIEGEKLKGIYEATDYIVRGNLPPEDLPQSMRARPEAGKHVAVIGGGDTSSDCVRTARRLQMQLGIADGVVKDYYRRTIEEMPGREDDRHHAVEEGVIYEYLVAPVRFIGDENGHVRQLELIRMRLGPPGKDGRRSPMPIEGSNFIVPADTVVLAIGYGGDPEIEKKTPGLKTKKPGIFQVDSEWSGRTTLERVYAAGDDVRGADLIVTAVAAARHVAHSMDDYLRGLPLKDTVPVKMSLPAMMEGSRD